MGREFSGTKNSSLPEQHGKDFMEQGGENPSRGKGGEKAGCGT